MRLVASGTVRSSSELARTNRNYLRPEILEKSLFSSYMFASRIPRWAVLQFLDKPSCILQSPPDEASGVRDSPQQFRVVQNKPELFKTRIPRKITFTCAHVCSHNSEMGGATVSGQAFLYAAKPPTRSQLRPEKSRKVPICPEQT